MITGGLGLQVAVLILATLLAQYLSLHAMPIITAGFLVNWL
jgi:hypothetical protein